MTTRVNHLSTDAAAPAGFPTVDRFRLVPTGGIRLHADSVQIASGRIDNFVNVINGQTYGANADMNYAVVEAVNGVNVAKFDPTLVATPTGYSLQNFGFGGLNTGQYTFAALWKVTDAFVGGKLREIIGAAYNGATTVGRAAIREDASGALQARAQRTTADAAAIASIATPTRIGGWCAAAAVFDWTNNLVTVHDLLGDESVGVAIAGASGVAPSDISAYRIGYYSSATERFVGQLADYVQLPYVPSVPELKALKLHMQARATDLAA